MKEDKPSSIYYCFKYKCKRCPKARECEKEINKKSNLYKNRK